MSIFKFRIAPATSGSESRRWRWTGLGNVISLSDVVGVTCIVIIMLGVSGQVKNHMHKPPFTGGVTNQGYIMWLSGSRRFQFQAETWVAVFAYTVFTSGFFYLNEARFLDGRTSRRRFAMLGLMFSCLAFSGLMHMLKAKVKNYPYKFLNT